MKKILLFVGAAALLFGCEAAAVKEVKATAVPDTENGVTMGDVFDTALQNASWKAGSDEAGAETVTVTGCGVCRRRYGRQCVFRRTGVSDGLRRLRRGGCVGSGRKSSRQNDSGRDRNFS